MGAVSAASEGLRRGGIVFVEGVGLGVICGAALVIVFFALLGSLPLQAGQCGLSGDYTMSCRLAVDKMALHSEHRP